MKPSSISLWSMSLLACVLLPLTADAGWRDRVIVEDGWFEVPRPPRAVGAGDLPDDDGFVDPEDGYDDPGYDYPNYGVAPDEAFPEDEIEPRGFSEPDLDGPPEPRRNTRAVMPDYDGGDSGPAVVPGLAPSEPARKRKPGTKRAEDVNARLAPPKPARAKLPRSAKGDVEAMVAAPGAPDMLAPGPRELGSPKPVPPRTAPAVAGTTPPKASPAAGGNPDQPVTTASIGKPVLGPGPATAGSGPVAVPVKRPNLEALDFAPSDSPAGTQVSEDRR
jgi:hypothetical protein